jgi:hypothetical protein
MVWEGRTRVVGQGGLIALGDAVVSREALMTFEGEEGSPDATMRFEVRNGRPECVEIVVRAKPDGRGIRSTDVAMFNIDTIAVDVFYDVGTIGVTDERAAVNTHRATQEAHASRRWAVTREELERVAKVYHENPQAPTQAVEMLLGYSKRTAARRVKQAEEAGLLPATTTGKRRGS